MSDENRSWLEKLSHALLREPKDREQLIDLLRDAKQRDLLDEETLGMIEGVLEISEIRIRDIMIPRAQMTTIQQDMSFTEFLPLVIESGHSRFPVMSEDQDNVVGILLAKDLLQYTNQPIKTNFNLRDLLRPVIFVPESKRLDQLLQDFRRTHNHMAIVIDEYGSTAGLVTIEDILEQIVGDIEDEYDIDEETFIKAHSKTQFIVKALTPVEEFNHYFSTELDENEFDTIGGLITNQFGHLPKRGETTQIDHLRFKVVRADNRRIYLLKVTLKKHSEKVE